MEDPEWISVRSGRGGGGSAKKRNGGLRVALLRHARSEGVTLLSPVASAKDPHGRGCEDGMMAGLSSPDGAEFGRAASGDTNWTSKTMFSEVTTRRGSESSGTSMGLGGDWDAWGADVGEQDELSLGHDSSVDPCMSPRVTRGHNSSPRLTQKSLGKLGSKLKTLPPRDQGHKWGSPTVPQKRIGRYIAQSSIDLDASDEDAVEHVRASDGGSDAHNARLVYNAAIGGTVDRATSLLLGGGGRRLSWGGKMLIQSPMDERSSGAVIPQARHDAAFLDDLCSARKAYNTYASLRTVA
mmetsp:Transcript_12314/g.24392  ORF Transcript_12314/g.24392 Transcript_12314/m.24392 type:complete len:296 (+) Transcript_12314:75-962(+)